MPTAAIYARQSFFKEDSCSIDMQIERSKAFCISQGWDYIVYDKDQGYSGKDTDRPDFRRMMKDIEDGKIDSVVVYKLDRISRNLRDFFDLMEGFKSREVGFRSITENFDTTTPMGRAMLAIIAVFAQLERETTAERVRDNMLERARMGIWNGGPIPFGFNSEKQSINIGGKNKEFSVLIPNPQEQLWVREFYAWYMEGMGSIRSNVFRANQSGIPTKTGAAWNTNQMGRILSNPLYCVADEAAFEYFSSLGVQIAAEQDFDGKHGLMWYNRRKPHNKTSKLRDRSEWILAVGGHLGYISGQTYVNVQKKLLANSEKPAREGTGKLGLLSGLVKCGKCNRGMTHYNYGVRTTWQYYKCRSRESQGPTVCDGQSVKAKLLEQTVVAALKQICADREYLEGIAREAKRKVKTDTTPLLEEQRFVTTRLSSLSDEQKELVKALGKKTLPLELIEERLIELEKEKLSVSNRLAELDLQLESQDWQQIDMDLVFGNLLKFNEDFETLDFDGKREFLRSIIKKIIIIDDNITIQIFFLPDFTPDKPPGTKKKPGNGSPSSNSPTDQYPGTFEMNGCFCGHFGSDLDCTCTPLQIQRYLGRISGPLLDRMDLHVEVPRVKLEHLQSGPEGESSAAMREMVSQARDVQQHRYQGSGISLNSQMRPPDLRRYCQLDESSHNLLKASFERLHLSARAYDRILKIARTIADLEPSDRLKTEHIGEALHYRTLDRKYWSS